MDPGALSGGRSRPGGANDNADCESEGDMQGVENGTGKRKRVKDEKGKQKATEDGKGMGMATEEAKGM